MEADETHIGGPAKGKKGSSIKSSPNKTLIVGAVESHIHNIFGDLKAWLTGTHHGVAPKYLQVYLSEYAFRFNRRGHTMSAFRSLLGIVAAKEPMPLTRLIEP